MRTSSTTTTKTHTTVRSVVVNNKYVQTNGHAHAHRCYFRRSVACGWACCTDGRCSNTWRSAAVIHRLRYGSHRVGIQTTSRGMWRREHFWGLDFIHAKIVGKTKLLWWKYGSLVDRQKSRSLIFGSMKEPSSLLETLTGDISIKRSIIIQWFSYICFFQDLGQIHHSLLTLAHWGFHSRAYSHSIMSVLRQEARKSAESFRGYRI